MGLESSVNDLLVRVQGERSISDLSSRVRSALGEITQLWNRDVEMYTYAEEPIRVVGDSPSTEELRSVLESQVREAWATAELWKQRFLDKSQTPSATKPSTATLLEDREVTALRSQVASLTQEVKRLESDKQRQQFEVSKGNNTAVLESQLRDARADASRQVESTKAVYEVQLNDLRRQVTDYTRSISEYERKVADLKSRLTEASIKSTTSQIIGNTTTTSAISGSPARQI